MILVITFLCHCLDVFLSLQGKMGLCYLGCLLDVLETAFLNLFSFMPNISSLFLSLLTDILVFFYSMTFCYPDAFLCVYLCVYSQIHVCNHIWRLEVRHFLLSISILLFEKGSLIQSVTHRLAGLADQ